MMPDEELNDLLRTLETHPRAYEAQLIWDRLSQLSTLPEGWLDGDGHPPSPEIVALARSTLIRLVIEHDVKRPSVYPTPAGGVQAEWIFGDWIAEVQFRPHDTHPDIRGFATQVKTDVTLEFGYDGPAAEATPHVAKWLHSL